MSLPNVDNLYFCTTRIRNIIQVINSRRMRLVGHEACTGERRGAYRVLVGRPEGKRTLGRPRHR
jgi:hypothetical protein